MALTNSDFIEVTSVATGNKIIIYAQNIVSVEVGASDRRLIYLVDGRIIHVSDTYATIKTALAATSA